jgi:hypothetical protein
LTKYHHWHGRHQGAATLQDGKSRLTGQHQVKHRRVRAGRQQVMQRHAAISHLIDDRLLRAQCNAHGGSNIRIIIHHQEPDAF